MDCPGELAARDRLGATWLNGLVRFVRSLRPIQGPGIIIRRTPNGTVFSARPAKARTSAVAVARNGLFEIESITDTGGHHQQDPDDDAGGPFVVNLRNCFYMTAGRTHVLTQEEVSGGGSDDEQTVGDVRTVAIDFPCILALVINAGEDDGESGETIAGLDTYDGIGELAAMQLDRGNYILPLYQFGPDGSVEIDFRIGPTAAMWEKGV